MRNLQKAFANHVAMASGGGAAKPSVNPAKKRLMRDFKKMLKDPPPCLNAAPNDDNIFFWTAVIFGPDDTPWEGGTFNLTLEFTDQYPNKAPVVKFVTKMFHPNIYQDGRICLDILQAQWTPIYDVAAILTSIQSLLNDPNPNSPANAEAAQLYQENRREYNRRVIEMVESTFGDGEFDGDGADISDAADGAGAGAGAGTEAGIFADAVAGAAAQVDGAAEG